MFHRFTFSVKELLSVMVLQVLQDTAEETTAGFGSIHSQEGQHFPGNKHRCNSKEGKSQSYFILLNKIIF